MSVRTDTYGKACLFPYEIHQRAYGIVRMYRDTLRDVQYSPCMCL